MFFRMSVWLYNECWLIDFELDSERREQIIRMTFIENKLVEECIRLGLNWKDSLLI